MIRSRARGRRAENSGGSSRDRNGKQAAWGKPARGTPRWPASLAVVAAIALYVTLPERLVAGPRWTLPALEALLLIPLSITNPSHDDRETRGARITSLVLVALVNAANLVSLILLVRLLIGGGKPTGKEIIVSAIQIWLTNVLIFGLWYWELDRGGPAQRTRTTHRQPDFLFPQMANPDVAPPDWAPGFLDYLYVAFTNATAFSPTDTMPLTRWAKSLMLVQSAASLVILALVAARAVNVLS